MIKEFFAKLVRSENPQAMENVRRFQEKNAEQRQLAKERQEMQRQNMPGFHRESTNPPPKKETSEPETEIPLAS